MIPLGLFIPTTLYEIVTVPLYWRIIYVLITNKEFSKPFYQFIWIIGICENAHYIVDVLYYRLPMVSFTADLFDKSPSRWLSLAPFAVYFFNYPVFFLQVAISINRFTALWCPVKQSKFWERWWRRIVLASFIFSLCLTLHRLPFNATTQLGPFIPAKPELGYVPGIIHYDYYSLDTNLISGIFYLIVLVLCMIVNAGTFVKIIKMRREGSLTNASSRLEVGLFMVVIWMMCSLVVLVLFQAANFIVRNNLLGQQIDQAYGLYIIYLQQPWVDDVNAVSHPWVLIAMSEPIRNAALPFLKGFFTQKSTTEAVISVITVTHVQPAVQNSHGKRFGISAH